MESDESGHTIFINRKVGHLECEKVQCFVAPRNFYFNVRDPNEFDCENFIRRPRVREP